jgi:hypothetical protein
VCCGQSERTVRRKKILKIPNTLFALVEQTTSSWRKCDLQRAVAVSTLSLGSKQKELAKSLA